MTDKYHCPKCKRCFVEWGAKKLEFKCPTEGCDQAELILLVSEYLYSEDKRKTKRSTIIATPVATPEDTIVEQDNTFSVFDDTVLDDDDDDDNDSDDDALVTLGKEKTANDHNP